MKKLGSIKWFGGNNNKTGRENQFGFITPMMGGDDVFAHKSAIQGIKKPVESDVVLYEEGMSKGKMSAENVTILTGSRLPFDELSTLIENLEPEYLKSLTRTPAFSNMIASAVNLCSTVETNRDYTIKCLEFIERHSFRGEIIGIESKHDLMAVHLMSPKRAYEMGVSFSNIMKRIAGRTEEFIELAKALPFEEQVKLASEISKTIICPPSNHKEEFKLQLVMNDLVRTTVFDNYEPDNPFQSYGLIKLYEYVESLITGEEPLPSFVSSIEELTNHPTIYNFIGKHYAKRPIYELMFKGDLSYLDLIENDERLKKDAELYILKSLLPLINGQNNVTVIGTSFLHSVWEGIVSGALDINDKGVFKLFPSCQKMGYQNLSCEAFVWKTPTGDTRHLCRGRLCNDNKVMPNKEHDHKENFAIYDWLSHYGIGYSLENGQPAKNDFAIKVSGYLNRIREIRERLDCRCCGEIMKPNLKYARIERVVLDRRTNCFVKKPFQAAYRATTFQCDTESCSQRGVNHYINHCLGFKCHEIIDGRDNLDKCSNGWLVCADCGSCCPEHKEKFGYN